MDLREFSRRFRVEPGTKVAMRQFDPRDSAGYDKPENADELLQQGVATLSCDAFGPSAVGHLRISLAAPDARIEDAARRIARYAGSL